MTDEDIERLLASIRPIGPPDQLRARIFSRRPAKPAWPWVVAAAATLALTTWLQSGAAAAREGIRSSTAGARGDLENDLMVAWRDTGGLSESEARLVAMAEQMAMRIEQNRPGPEKSEQ